MPEIETVTDSELQRMFFEMLSRNENNPEVMQGLEVIRLQAERDGVPFLAQFRLYCNIASVNVRARQWLQSKSK